MGLKSSKKAVGKESNPFPVASSFQWIFDPLKLLTISCVHVHVYVYNMESNRTTFRITCITETELLQVCY